MAEKKPMPLFVGEDLALDFLNTVAAPAGRPIDWIEDGDELVSWLELTGALPPEAAKHFRTSVRAPDLDAVAGHARQLREWFRSFVTSHAGMPLGTEALTELGPVNAILVRDCTYRQISAGQLSGHALQWNFNRHWDEPQSLLLPIADAIGELVCEKEFTFVRQCEAAPCTLWFHDMSKSHARRWCSMAVCGNRAKAAAHRNRIRQRRSGEQNS